MDVDWGELYRTTLPDLVRFLHRKVWDMERARDLAQDTFVRALRENPANPRAWLFTVAANLARDEARTAIRRKGHLTLLKTEAEVHAVNVDPAAELEQGEREAVVRRALEALSERDREALLLWGRGARLRRDRGSARNLGGIGRHYARPGPGAAREGTSRAGAR